MARKPLVSFIIPVYNAKAFVSDLTSSFVDLSFTFEALIVDDCSSDDSGRMIVDAIRSLGHRAKLIRNKKNLGQSASRNIAIRIAEGDYVQFIDSDDLLVSSLENELITFVQSTGSDLVFFEAEAFPDHPSLSEEARKMSAYYKRNVRKYPAQLAGRQMFYNMVHNYDWKPSPCLYIFKRSLIPDRKRFFREGELMEDNAASIEIALRASGSEFFPVRVYRRRVRSDSTTMRADLKAKRIRGYLIAATDVLELMNNEQLDDSSRQGIQNQAELLVTLALRNLQSGSQGSSISTFSPALSKLHHQLNVVIKKLKG